MELNEMEKRLLFQVEGDYQYKVLNRLSLGGTSHVALIAFLKRHPEIRRVSLYMDNDLGGLKNARRIKAPSL